MSAVEHISADADSIINNDRDLLEKLNFTDADAAMFLGRSRQALGNKLHGKEERDTKAPNDYFKIADILRLVSVRVEDGEDVPGAAIETYVLETRPLEEERDRILFKRLQSLLKPTAIVKRNEVQGIVLILPGYSNWRSTRPRQAEAFKTLLQDYVNNGLDPELICISPTSLRANITAQLLEIEDRATCISSEIADHYIPTVLLYVIGASQPLAFVLTNRGTLVRAPHYRADALSDCVQSMGDNAVWKKFRAKLAYAS